MRPDQLSFLLTNMLAAAGLAVTALLEFQLGFVITNVLWVVVSAAALGTDDAAVSRNHTYAVAPEICDL